MRLLMLTRYDRLGASSRLRSLQYIPDLEAAGFSVMLCPLFEAEYLQRQYAGQPVRLSRLLQAYARRIWQLCARARPDLIWLEKELLPWLPAAVECWLLPRGVPVVCDYDDAVFHRYDRARHPAIRWFLGQKIARIMQRAQLVVAGNDYLAGYAQAAGARQTAIVPTVIDLDHYASTALPAADGKLRLGWIGSPSTYALYLAPLLPRLCQIAAAEQARITVVGAPLAAAELTAPELAKPGLIEAFAWTEARESQLIQGMAIGLMPLDASAWAQGKCGYKLLQYMACGVPVVASDTAANAAIVTAGENGFLVRGPDEWQQAITLLLRDADLRRRMGQAGRARVEAGYALQHWGPHLAGRLRQLARG